MKPWWTAYDTAIEKFKKFNFNRGVGSIISTEVEYKKGLLFFYMLRL